MKTLKTLKKFSYIALFIGLSASMPSSSDPQADFYRQVLVSSQAAVAIAVPVAHAAILRWCVETGRIQELRLRHVIPVISNFTVGGIGVIVSCIQYRSLPELDLALLPFVLPSDMQIKLLLFALAQIASALGALAGPYLLERIDRAIDFERPTGRPMSRYPYSDGGYQPLLEPEIAIPLPNGRLR